MEFTPPGSPPPRSPKGQLPAHTPTHWSSHSFILYSSTLYQVCSKQSVKKIFEWIQFLTSFHLFSHLPPTVSVALRPPRYKSPGWYSYLSQSSTFRAACHGPQGPLGTEVEASSEDFCASFLGRWEVRESSGLSLGHPVNLGSRLLGWEGLRWWWGLKWERWQGGCPGRPLASVVFGFRAEVRTVLWRWPTGSDYLPHPAPPPHTSRLL